MEQFVWHEKTSVILTSATLTANEGFDYIRNRLNADEADEIQLGSPFDYETAAMLYLANDIPEPNDANGYQRAVDQALIRLAKATDGRMLALFTSYAQLQAHVNKYRYTAIGGRDHRLRAGRRRFANTLLETFREADKAVLLGTRSFWEGVDIPGEALSVLVIVKLPFDVPVRSDHRRPLRDLRGPIQRIPPSGSHLTLPPGIWPPDPHPIRPRDRRHPRPAHPHQTLWARVS